MYPPPVANSSSPATERPQTEAPHQFVGCSEPRERYGQTIRRAIYVSLGLFFLLLALVGVLLPGLPTTPFLLLSSYFLARSSPKLHQALVSNRWVGPILRDWQEHRAISPRVKVQALAVIAVATIALVWFSQLPPYALMATLLLVAVGLVVVLRLPTISSREA